MSWLAGYGMWVWFDWRGCGHGELCCLEEMQLKRMLLTRPSQEDEIKRGRIVYCNIFIYFR